MSKGFTFNGKHCNEFGITMRSRNRAILPRLNSMQVKIPGQHGMLDFGQNKYENRFISVDCFIHDNSISDLRNKTRSIAYWLSEKATLIFDDEPSLHYIGRIYDQVDFENILNGGFFSIVFEVEPFAYGEKAKLKKEMKTAEKLSINYQGTAESCTRITISNFGTNTINGITLTYGRLNNGSN